MEPKPFPENAPSTRRQAQFAFAVALLCAPSFALPALGLMAEFADGPLLDQIFSLTFLAMLLGVVSPIPALVALFLVLVSFQTLGTPKV